MTATTTAGPGARPLTEAHAARDAVIARLWGEGRTAREIGDQLGLACTTVEAIVRRRRLPPRYEKRQTLGGLDLAEAVTRRCPACATLFAGTVGGPHYCAGCR